MYQCSLIDLDIFSGLSSKLEMKNLVSFVTSPVFLSVCEYSILIAVLSIGPLLSVSFFQNNTERFNQLKTLKSN